MAKQRQTDVNIVYKVDTSQLDKANQLLGQSSRATDALRKQTQTFGQQSAASYKFTSKAIEGMEIEVARLRQQVKLASTQNVADVKRLSDQYKSAKAQLDSYKKSLLEVGKVTKDNAEANKSMAASLSTVINSAKLLLTAGIAREVVDISLNLAKVAGNAEGVGRAFNRAFPNSVAIMNRLKEATHNTVSEFELMQRTLQATNLGVDVESLPVLFEFAAARAQQTGESVDYLVDSIVRGIGRKSLLILDNLGLSATRLKEQFNGASLASQSVGEVTRGVSEIARVELAKMGGYAETSATKVDQLTASVQGLKEAFAKKATEGGGNVVTEFFNDIAKGLTEVIKGEKTLSTEQSKNRAAREIERITQSKQFKDLKDDYRGQIDLLFQELLNRRSLIKLREREIELAKERREELVNDLTILNLRAQLDPLDAQIKSQEESKVALEESVLIIQKYLLELRKLGTEVPDALGLIQAKMEEIDDLEDKIKASRSTEELKRLNVQMERLKAELHDLQQLGLFENKMFSDIDKTLKPLEEVQKKAKSAVNEFVNMNEVIKRIKESIDNLTVPTSAAQPSILQKDFWDELTEQIQANRIELKQTGIDILTDQLVSMEDAEVASLERRLEANRQFYDQQIALTGDNQRARMELEIRSEREAAEIKKRIAEKEWKAKRNAVLIDTAAGIAKNLAQYPYPFWIVPNLITAAQGAAQLAIVNRNKPAFAKGVIDLKGPGTKTSDSIDARLSRGESVMTADETMSSKGVLKAVRARKLNDKVLSEILSGKSGGAIINKFDDKGIIQKLDEIKNSQPSIEEHAGTVYKVVSKGKDYKQRIRLRVMSR